MADIDIPGQVERYHAEIWRSPTAATFLRERGIRHSTVERFRLGYVPGGYFRGRLAIPYQTGLYRWRNIRYRYLPGAGQADHKYLGGKGTSVHVFAPRAADEATPVICEGELDAISCWTAGIKAVGIPGATVWQDHWALLFRNAEEVILAFDPDLTGTRGGKKVSRSLGRFGISTRFAEIPTGQDMNDVLVSGGAQGVKKVLYG